jgi:Ankyrin repeat
LPLPLPFILEVERTVRNKPRKQQNDPRMDGQDNQEGLDVAGVEEEDFDAILARLEDLPLEELHHAFAARPELARVTDAANGWTLLHHVVHKGVSAERAFIVAHYWPESVQHRGREGELPLHLANAETDPAVVLLLLRRWPEAARHSYGAADEAENYPFFCAIRNGAPPQIVLLLFGARYGDGAVMGADHPAAHDGVRALQIALEGNADPVVAGIVHTGWPDSIHATFGRGRTPLHVAVAHGASHAVVRDLIGLREEAVLERDENGCLPIHYVRSFTEWVPGEVLFQSDSWQNADTAQLLIQTQPVCMLLKNTAGQLAVHKAVQTNSLALVQVLVEQSLPYSKYVRTLLAHDAAGSTPLHVAVARPDAPAPVVKYLVEQGPGALRERDNNGFLPWELAVSSGAPLDVLFLCVSTWPECLPPGGDRA